MSIRKYVTLIESAQGNKLFESDEHLNDIVSHFSDEHGISDIDELIDEVDTDEIIDDIVDNYTPAHLFAFLDHADIDYDDFTLPNGKHMIKVGSGVVYDERFHNDASEFIYDISDDDILDIHNHDYTKWSNKFWESVGRKTYAYHATTEDNWDTIQHEGLETRNDTRGMTNRSTGSAVFTTLNAEELDLGIYGDVHLAIDLAGMKQDGYMPDVSEEEPWIVDNFRRSLGHALDVEHEGTHGDGISPDTLVIYGSIDPKYIERID